MSYLLCEVELVEVVVIVDGGPQPLVILLGDGQLVESLVHHRQVVLLHTGGREGKGRGEKGGEGGLGFGLVARLR